MLPPLAILAVGLSLTACANLPPWDPNEGADDPYCWNGVVMRTTPDMFNPICRGGGIGV